MSVQRLSLALALTVTLIVQTVAAATEVRHVGRAKLHKSHEEVMAALLDYGNWCEKGCKYESPGVVVDQKLRLQKTPTHFFTWTWIRGIKDTKYFSEVTVHRRPSATVITSRALTKGESARIDRFERATGRPHNALFDRSVNVITVRSLGNPNAPSTEILFETSVTVSGFLALFPKKLKAGLRDSTEAVFAALRS